MSIKYYRNRKVPKKESDKPGMVQKVSIQSWRILKISGKMGINWRFACLGWERISKIFGEMHGLA
ncbi:MAG: hypothetical protein KDK54_17755 [Leptospiraceae bacterium]|nr:hypothetical protein [Leptospiraceae bacterium]